MDDADAPDPDRMDLVVRLCTRAGMIVEDMTRWRSIFVQVCVSHLPPSGTDLVLRSARPLYQCQLALGLFTFKGEQPVRKSNATRAVSLIRQFPGRPLPRTEWQMRMPHSPR